MIYPRFIGALVNFLDDGTTETTNEGEGIDENLCLLGDETVAECEVSEADIDGVDLSDEPAADEDAETTRDIEIDVEQQSLLETDSIDKEVDDIDAAEEISSEEQVQLKENEVREVNGSDFSHETCLNCENTTKCLYHLLEESGEVKYLCTYNCVKEHLDDNPDKYTLTQNKVIIQEIPPAENSCSKCDETKLCEFRYKEVTATSDDTQISITPVEDASEKLSDPSVQKVKSTQIKYLCERDTCLKEFIGDNTEKYIVKELKKRSKRVRTPKPSQSDKRQEEIPKVIARSDAEVDAARQDREQSFVRKCAQCSTVVNFTSKSVQWETFDFCNENCLGQYQNLIGSTCIQCSQVVALASIGKLCVRFGPEIHQFCSSTCLNDFKKSHQTCSLCSKGLNRDGEVDTIVTKRSNNFCDHQCAKRYDNIINPRKKFSQYVCSVCNINKSPKVEVLLDGHIHRLCSNPCFSAFKFVNNVNPDQCDMCTQHFERKSNDSFTIYQGETPKMFCSKICMNVYITKNRDIWQCNWCKVSKYNFDMLQLNFGKTRMCSVNCLSLYEVSVSAMARKRSKCDHCKLTKQPQYSLTMSDSSMRSFCTYQCALGFQGQFSKHRAASETPSVIPSGTAKRIKPKSSNCTFLKSFFF